MVDVSRFTNETYLDWATAAAAGHRPGLVVMVVDREGLLVAVCGEPELIGLDCVRTTWQRLLALIPPGGSASAVVVSLGASFDAAGAAGLLPDLRHDGAAIGWEVVDWLVETGGQTASVAACQR